MRIALNEIKLDIANLIFDIPVVLDAIKWCR